MARPRNVPDITAYLKVCGGHCGRMTRPTWMLKAEAPDTVTRGDATHCLTCRKTQPLPARTPKPEPEPAAVEGEREIDPQISHTLKGLGSFMQRRKAREQRMERITDRKVLNEYRGTGNVVRALCDGGRHPAAGVLPVAGRARREA